MGLSSGGHFCRGEYLAKNTGNVLEKNEIRVC